MNSKLYALFLGSLFTGIAASAQIGDSQIDCQRKYGAKVTATCPVYGRIKWERLDFYKDPYTMAVFFLDQKAAAVVYKVNRTFAGAEISHLLAINGIAAGPVELPAAAPATVTAPAETIAPEAPEITAEPSVETEEEVVSEAVPPAKYKVKANDCISKIAHKFHVSQTALMKANNLDPKKPLRIGQALNIPSRTQKRLVVTTTTTTTVQESQTIVTPAAAAPVYKCKWAIPGLTAYLNSTGNILTIMTDSARAYVIALEGLKSENDKSFQKEEFDRELYERALEP